MAHSEEEMMEVGEPDETSREAPNIECNEQVIRYEKTTITDTVGNEQSKTTFSVFSKKDNAPYVFIENPSSTATNVLCQFGPPHRDTVLQSISENNSEPATPGKKRSPTKKGKRPGREN